VPHRTLERQLKKAGLRADALPSSLEAWAILLERVDRSYQDNDSDRYLLERSLQQVSDEMRALYEELRQSKESALRQERDKLTAIINVMADGLATLDADLRLLSLNPAGRALLGLPEGAPLPPGLDLRALLGPAAEPAPENSAADEIADSLRRVCAEGVCWRCPDLALRCQDGHLVPISSAVSPLPGGDFVWLFHDIRDQKAAQEALRRGRAAAEQHSRLKSAFLTNMSHEIRTPMNAVIGMTGLLLDTELNAEQAEYASIVQSSGRHLLALIDSVLDFSKIEAGRLELELRPFELRALCDEVLEMFAERASSQDVELSCLVAPELPRGLIGDAGRLRQLLINLVGNALKFTERGEVAVEVSAAEGGLLRFAVIDSGEGCDPALLPILFDPFTQADTSTTRRVGGTGLGLAISKQLAELMGGEIGATSTLGAGSTFWFTARLPAVGQAPAFAPRHAGTRVLIVDHHARSRAVLSGVLREAACEVDSVGSGLEAFGAVHTSLAAGRGYDLLLIDADLPVLKGAELVRILRTDPRTAGWGMALLLRLGTHRSVDPALGLLAPLAKPIRAEATHHWLSRALDPDPTAAPLPAHPVSTRAQQGALAAPTLPPALPATATAPRTAPDPTGPRVLVAEDTPVNQIYVRRVLERVGVPYDLVPDGDHAVRAFAEGSYALILMDCMMPVMDGFTATRRIRAIEQQTGRHVPIIAMTANAMAGARAECLAAGMDDYVSKPVDAQQIVAVLSRYVEVGAPTKAGPAVLRSETLRAFTEGLPSSTQRRILESFLEDATATVAQLRAAADAGDASAALAMAHRLRSATGYIGAEELGHQAALAEDLASRGAATALPARCAALEQAFHRAQAAVEERLRVADP
jgi:two-component system sensor histidine kinase/response regulator